MKSVQIFGNEVSLQEIREDVEAAKDKGYSGRYAFTPETVKALLDALEEAQAEKALWIAQNEANAEENQKLRDVNRKQFEEIERLNQQLTAEVEERQLWFIRATERIHQILDLKQELGSLKEATK